MQNISNIQEFTVSDLSKSLKSTIEERFSYIKLKGEVSGFKKHSSGHCYFSLKDEKSVIDAVIWKGNAQKLSFALKDGLEVMGTGKVTTYAGRSKYQIILDDLKPAGAGALMALLEELKSKLRDEGLFREDIKKPLPFLPKHIGIITSPTGAVIRDILHRLNDRFFPHIYVFPVAVQGDLSARQISYAIRYFNKCDKTTMVKRPDIIIVARGGGSIEDLWSFNEEIVARSVAASQIPIISAVGHETDFTLCDFAADKRAPTPTAAAEIATPIKDELESHLISIKSRLRNALHNFLSLKKNKYHNISHNIPNIKDRLGNFKDAIRFISQNLSYALKKNIWVQRKAYNNISYRHRKELPTSLIQKSRNKNALYTLRLTQSMRSIISNHKHIIQHQKQATVRLDEKINNGIRNKIKGSKEAIVYISKILQNMSYKNVLNRGYTVIHDDKGIITSKVEAEKRKPIKIEFKDGEYNL